MNELPYWCEYLHSEFNARKNKNPKYSTYSYARHLQISQSLLSLFMNQKRKPSLKTAKKMAESLRLDYPKMIKFVSSINNKNFKNEHLAYESIQINFMSCQMKITSAQEIFKKMAQEFKLEMQPIKEPSLYTLSIQLHPALE